MSIIPGIENFEPERTETSSGFAGSPNLPPDRHLDLRQVLPHVFPELGGELASPFS